MEDYEKERPKKTIFSEEEQLIILEKAKEFVLDDLLPDENINKLLIFGSLAKKSFGVYEKEWKHGLYSDIDILLLVEDNFEIPKGWEKWHIGDDFGVYVKGWLLDKYMIQYMVWKKKEYSDREKQISAEPWGVPLMLGESKNPYILIYEKK